MFLSTTRKLCARIVSGSLLGRRRHDSLSEKSKSCWSHFFIWKALTSSCSCQRTRRSTSLSTRRSSVIFFALYERKDERKKNEICGRINHGCFTTTMHQLITPWTSSRIRLREISPNGNNLLIHMILICVFFPQPQEDHQGGADLKVWRLRGL